MVRSKPVLIFTLTCKLRLQSMGGGVALGLCESFWPEWLARELAETKFDMARFVRNFAMFRIVLDITFYLGHRALHVNEHVYNLIVSSFGILAEPRLTPSSTNDSKISLFDP